jgi:hypothetical protein
VGATGTQPQGFITAAFNMVHTKKIKKCFWGWEEERELIRCSECLVFSFESSLKVQEDAVQLTLRALTSASQFIQICMLCYQSIARRNVLGDWNLLMLII